MDVPYAIQAFTPVITRQPVAYARKEPIRPIMAHRLVCRVRHLPGLILLWSAILRQCAGDF